MVLERRQEVETAAVPVQDDECTWEESLSLDAKMFKAEGEDGFEEKTAKLTVVQVESDGTKKTVPHMLASLS